MLGRKCPQNSGHPSTKGRIRMQYGGHRKDSTESKQRQFSYVGGLPKNWHSHLSRAYPGALKNTHTQRNTQHNQTELLGLQTETGPGALPPATLDPHCLPSLPQGPCSKHCRSMPPKKHSLKIERVILC